MNGGGRMASARKINPIGPYYAGALRTAIASCFINGKITEQQIGFVKEVISNPEILEETP